MLITAIIYLNTLNISSRQGVLPQDLRYIVKSIKNNKWEKLIFLPSFIILQNYNWINSKSKLEEHMDKITSGKKILFIATTFIVGIYFLFLSLVEAKGFLAPLVMGIVLALLMIPLSNKLEKTFLNRGFSSLICTLFLFII